MKKLIVALAMLTILTACSSVPAEVEVVTKPIEKPALVLPPVDKFKARTVEYIVVTPENAESVFNMLEGKNESIVLFAISANGYENVSLNMADLLKLVQQQQLIIAAYKKYYEDNEQ